MKAHHSFRRILRAAVLAPVVLTAASANAAPIATLSSEAPSDTNTDNHVGAIQATVGDLLETVGSVASEGAVGDASRHVTASVFNGKISTGVANGSNGNDVNSPTAAGYWGDNHFIEFDLDTSTNVQGYDISLIQIIQMGDSFRPGIHVTVSLRQVSGSYTPLIAPPDAGIGGNVNRYAITSGSGPFIASGIDGVRFDFSNTVGTISGWTWYRELDVVGEPSGPRPEIAVEQPLGTNIPTNGTKDFRWVSVGSHSDLVFTIKNTGTADLTGLTITKDGTNAGDFTVTSDPTVPLTGPDGSTTFTVRFAPTAPGARSAAIHIANNDYNENPFHINLTGIGTTAVDRQSGALRIFLLAGQSNMEGQAYAFDSATTAGWNVPTMQFLLSGTAAATNYLANMPFGFKTSLNPDWLLPRNDAWAVHYNSSTGAVKDVLPTNNPADILSGIQSLGPGFGAGTGNGAMIGPELAMGIRLADATGDPVFLFKSSAGGTTLGNDWRPPAAVAARGGSVGVNYSHTVNRFVEFLDALDADLADDGRLNGYNNATSYTVSGVVWFQGWNEMFDDAPYTAAQLQAEYKDNLKDLVRSLRAADTRMPANLPLIIPESSDQNANLNAGRVAAVAELNAEIANSAVYIENNEMIGTFWGNNELGVPFSTDWGYHFNARAENYLEIGWRIGGAALANGYIISNSATVDQSLTGPGGPFAGQTNPEVVGFTANPDGDNWVNALEVLFGFNPAVADGGMPMTTTFATDGADTWLEVHVTLDAAMDDLLIWHLEFSSDLENWTESSTPRTVAGQSGSLRTLAIRDDQAAGTTPGRFYRIKVLAGE